MCQMSLVGTPVPGAQRGNGECDGLASALEDDRGYVLQGS